MGTRLTLSVVIAAVCVISIVTWLLFASVTTAENSPESAITAGRRAHSVVQEEGPGAADVMVRYSDAESRASASSGHASKGGRGPHCRVIVESENGERIAGARLAVIGLSALREHGISDAQGEWSLTETLSKEPLLLCVEANGYARREIAFDRGLPEVHRVVLNSEATISGIVSRPGGTAPPDGIRVFAWTGETAPNLARFTALDSGAPTILTAQVSKTGAFVLAGVSPLKTYSLCAGGRGWTTVDPIHATPGTTAPAQMTLWRLYGCIVRAKMRSGGVVPPSLAGSTYLDLDCGDNEYRDVDYPSLALAAAGTRKLAGVRNRQLHDWRSRLVMIAVRVSSSDPLSFTLSYAIPGIRRRSVKRTLEAIDSAIPSYDVVLDAKRGEFGDLDLTFAGGNAQRAVRAIHGFGPASLQLVSVDGGDHLRIPMLTLANGRRRIEGIPYGAYDARLVLKGGRVLRPQQGARIVVGKMPANALWRLDSVGTVLLEPQNYNPSRRSLAVTVHFLTGTGTGNSDHTFYRPPYFIEGINPGEYSIKIIGTSRSKKAVLAQLGPVVVRAAKITRVKFKWPR